MKCDEFEEQIHRSLDRRATPWSCERLREHADTCAACRDLLATYEAMSDGLAFFEIEDLDATFSQSVVSQVATIRRRPRQRINLGIAMAVVAASVLWLVLPNILSWRSATPDPRPRQVTSGEQAPDEPVQDATRADPQDVDQVRALLAEWKSRWSANEWKPVDRLEGGFAPITTTLFIAIDELRATIPLGRTARPAEAPSDSAGIWIDAHLANTA